MPETLLIVDPDVTQLRATEQMIQQKLHYRTVTAVNAEAAMHCLRSGKPAAPDAMLFDMTLADRGGLDLVRAARGLKPEMPILVLTKYGDRGQTTSVLQAGASDYLTKPVELERLQLSLQQALKLQRMNRYIVWLERKVAGHMDLTDLVGQTPAFRQALMQASDAAASKKPVWITGEEGTGRELFARAIHGSSDRAGKPFVAVNCRMMPESMAHAILFGQEKMEPASPLQFTLGKLREADRGTLLLEDVEHLPLALQRQLAGMLADGIEEADVRLICSGRSSDKIDPGLYRCLCEVVISLPPLAARREDISLLADHFLAMYATSENKYIPGMTETARQWLLVSEWPGNVQQLANTVWRAVALTGGELLDVDDLQAAQRSKPGYAGPVLLDENGKIKTLRSVQEEAIRFALEHAGGCMTRAARTLGIGRSTLYRKVSQLELGRYISRANQTTRPMMNVSSIERS